MAATASVPHIEWDSIVLRHSYSSTHRQLQRLEFVREIRLLRFSEAYDNTVPMPVT